MLMSMYAKKDKKQSLIFYLVLIAIFALPVGHLFFKMWTQGAYLFFKTQINLPIAPEAGSSLQPIVMAGSGLYLSWLVLFANDWRKRYQGYVFIVGTLVIVGILTGLGVGIPNLNLTSPINIVSFLGGLVIGFVSETRDDENELGGDLTKIDLRHPESTWAHWITSERDRKTPAEFPVAYRGLLVFIVLVVIGANVLNVVFNQNILQVGLHLVSSSVLLYLLYGFLDINVMAMGGDDESEGTIEWDKKDDNRDIQFEVLGPQQSGKTYLALGLHLTLTRDDNYTLKSAGGRMPDILEAHAERTIGVSSGLVGWGIGNTMIDAAQKIYIEFTKAETRRGELLTATVNMLDYPGEVLVDLAEGYNREKEEKLTDGGRPPDGTDEPNVAGQKQEDYGTLDEVIGQQTGEHKPTEKRDDTEKTISGNNGQRSPETSTNVRREVTEALIKNVGEADKLIVLLDSQRFVTGEDIIQDDPGMMLKEMTQIVQAADPDEIIPVATKADYLMKDYDNLETDEIPENDEFEEFRDHVHEMIDTGHPIANTLLELSDYPVFPVYYLTGKDENGDWKLNVRDGRVHPVGYDQLINAVVNK